MAYDSARGRIVMFGGSGNAYPSELGDTWEWDGKNWTRGQPTNSPGWGDASVRADDSARQCTVLTR